MFKILLQCGMFSYNPKSLSKKLDKMSIPVYPELSALDGWEVLQGAKS